MTAANLIDRYSSGARRYDTNIYACGEYPLNLIGPATILWSPDSGFPTKLAKPRDVKIREWRKQNNKITPAEDVNTPAESVRTLWIQLHPAMFDLVQNALQKAAAKVLTGTEGSPDSSSSTVEITDLRDQIIAFDLVGPKSTSILQGVLDLVKDGTTNSDEVLDVRSIGPC